MSTKTREPVSTCITRRKEARMGRIVGLVFKDLAEQADLEARAGLEDLEELTKAELKEKLEDAGIEYDDKMTKDELIALFKGEE